MIAMPSKRTEDLIIDKSAARKELEQFFQKIGQNPTKWEKESFANTVIEGRNKTFKYILLTALLAKVVEPRINTLCLQKQANIRSGAYDPRSLCSEVVSPFEIKYLSSIMGGSRDPFVNKPARFPVLSIDNPSKDPDIRDAAFNCLAGIGEDSAKDGLMFCLWKLKKQSDDLAKTTLSVSKINDESNKKTAYEFLNELADHNFGGESLVIVSTVAFKLMNASNRDIRVVPHPVNQSGASSQQYGDIDLYYRQNLVFCEIEAKDKQFTSTDLIHAASNCPEHTQCLFIQGRHAKNQISDQEYQKICNESLQKDIPVSIVPIDSLVALAFSTRQRVSISEVLNLSFECAKAIKCMPETLKYLHDVAQRYADLTQVATTKPK